MNNLVQRHKNLQPYNTMNLPVIANYYVQARNNKEVIQAANFAVNEDLPLWILGGGSNVIFMEDYNGLVLHIVSKGINIIDETEEDIVVQVAAGEIWDEFLQYCIKQQWYGLENLAIIPGVIGAAPIQNIGAYGQEVADCIERVHVINIDDLSESVLQKNECQFEYRNSIFKNTCSRKYIITAVDFRLHKKFTAYLGYQVLADYLQKIPSPSVQDVRNAVIAIRQSKLPLPSDIANAGSFFKNPIIEIEQYQLLLQKYPETPAFKQSATEIKLAAAWLIEQCGWKGKNLGSVGMYEKQALILVNHGGASYADVKQLLEQIQKNVNQRFNVMLEPEPIFIGREYHQ